MATINLQRTRKKINIFESHRLHSLHVTYTQTGWCFISFHFCASVSFVCNKKFIKENYIIRFYKRIIFINFKILLPVILVWGKASRISIYRRVFPYPGHCCQTRPRPDSWKTSRLRSSGTLTTKKWQDINCFSTWLLAMFNTWQFLYTLRKQERLHPALILHNWSIKHPRYH